MKVLLQIATCFFLFSLNQLLAHDDETVIGPHTLQNWTLVRWEHTNAPKCQGIFELVLRWDYKNKTTHQHTTFQNLTKFNETTASLSLKNSPENNGCWRWTANGNGKPSFYHRQTIIVAGLGSPNSAVANSSYGIQKVYATEGSNITWACHFPNFGVIEWEYEQPGSNTARFILQLYNGTQDPIIYQVYKDRTTFNKEVDEITLSNLQKSDAGTYTCKPDLREEQKVTWTLTIMSPTTPPPPEHTTSQEDFAPPNEHHSPPVPCPCGVDPTPLMIITSLLSIALCLLIGWNLYKYWQSLNCTAYVLARTGLL